MAAMERGKRPGKTGRENTQLYTKGLIKKQGCQKRKKIDPRTGGEGEKRELESNRSETKNPVMPGGGPSGGVPVAYRVDNGRKIFASGVIVCISIPKKKGLPAKSALPCNESVKGVKRLIGGQSHKFKGGWWGESQFR